MESLGDRLDELVARPAWKETTDMDTRSAGLDPFGNYDTPLSGTEGGATSKPPARAHAAPTSGPARATRERVRATIGRLRSCTCERGFLTDRLSECQAFEHSAPAVKLVF